jgi:hypothetical protein
VKYMVIKLDLGVKRDEHSEEITARFALGKTRARSLAHYSANAFNKFFTSCDSIPENQPLYRPSTLKCLSPAPFLALAS